MSNERHCSCQHVMTLGGGIVHVARSPVCEMHSLCNVRFRRLADDKVVICILPFDHSPTAHAFAKDDT